VDLGLKGKVAVLSAASRGIGLACAKALAREGAEIAICARDPQQLDAAAKAITAAGAQKPLTVQADLTDEQAVGAFMQRVEDRFGKVNIVVANSVGPPPGVFEGFASSAWQQAFEGALLSSVHLIRAALPALLKADGACVVGIQSTSVRQPIPGLTLSNGIRPAVAGLFKSLAIEYGPKGVRFNLVCPGRIKTERFLKVEASYGEPLDERIAKKAAEVPLRRLGEAEEVADAVVFLASPRAGYITGSVISVDGGNTRGIF